jgi:Cys-rich repeat protein
MQQPRFSFVRLAPTLFASALLAATTACTITITEPERDDECPALDELCPNLACENGNVVVEGCPICECDDTPACEGDEPPPEGCRLDDNCELVCEPDGCTSDADCGDGFYCAFFGPEPEPGSDEDQAQRPLTGSCEPLVVEPGCTSDIDCDDGYFCSFETPTSPPGDGAEDPGLVAPQGECVRREEGCTADIDCAVGSLCENGVCVASRECFLDEDCAAGFHCETLDAPTGLIALPGGVCVPDDQPTCTSDADCNGGSCVTTCEADPNCPNCDVCLFVSTCVDTGCTVNEDCDAGEICFFGDAAANRAIACPDENNDGQCDFDVPAGGVCRTAEAGCTVNADCAENQFCDFDTSADRIAPCVDNDSDGVCDDVIVVQTGVCRDFEATCTVDADCAAGEVCQIDDDCVCAGVCIDDGNGGCVPCECALAAGICVVPVNPACVSDADCGDGQVCSFGFDQRPVPCLDADTDGVCDFALLPPTGVCVDVVEPPTNCSTDADCENGEFCSFDDAPVDGGQAIVPPLGVCVELNVDPCAAVRCEAGTACVVEADGQAVCLAVPTRCNDDTACAAGEICNEGVCSGPTP